jgi:hypothetical protein
MHCKSWSSGAARNWFLASFADLIVFRRLPFHAKDIGAEDEVGLAVMAEMRSLKGVGKELLAAASSVGDYTRINVRPRVQIGKSTGELHEKYE